MRSRRGIEGTRAELEKLAAVVDAKLGYPRLGRDHLGNEIPADRGGVTLTAAEIEDHPTDPSRALYEVAPENEAAVLEILAAVRGKASNKRTPDEEKLALLPAAKVRDVEWRKPVPHLEVRPGREDK